MTYSIIFFFMPLPFKDQSSLEEPSFSQLANLLWEKNPHTITALTGTYFDRSMSCRSQSCGRRANTQYTETSKMRTFLYFHPQERSELPAYAARTCLKHDNLGGKGGEPFARLHRGEAAECPHIAYSHTRGVMVQNRTGPRGDTGGAGAGPPRRGRVEKGQTGGDFSPLPAALARRQGSNRPLRGLSYPLQPEGDLTEKDPAATEMTGERLPLPGPR